MKKVVNSSEQQNPLDFFQDNVMLLACDIDFTIVSGNKRFEETTGLSAADIEGKHLFNQLFHALPIYVIDDIKFTIKQGKTWQGNLNLPAQGNPASWYNVSINSTYNNERIKIGYTIICTSGKSQSDLITANDSRETWMKAFFNDPEEANILLNLDGSVIEFNETAHNFIKWYSEKNLTLESNVGEYLEEDFRETFQTLIDNAKCGLKQSLCRPFFNPLNQQKIFEIELRPVFSADMTPMGFVLVIIEITAKVELVKRIRKSEKRLDDIAFINAHEVRAPLASILGLINLLDLEDADESSRELLNMLKQSSRDLEKIILKVSETTYLPPAHKSKKASLKTSA